MLAFLSPTVKRGVFYGEGFGKRVVRAAGRPWIAVETPEALAGILRETAWLWLAQRYARGAVSPASDGGHSLEAAYASGDMESG